MTALNHISKAQIIDICSIDGIEYGCVDVKDAAWLDFIINDELPLLDSLSIVVKSMRAIVDSLIEHDKNRIRMVDLMWDRLDTAESAYEKELGKMNSKLRRRKIWTKIYQSTTIGLISYLIIDKI